MRFSTTLLVLVLFLAALGAYLHLRVPTPAPEPEEPEPLEVVQSTQVLPLERGEKISLLQIQKPSTNETRTLALEEGEWVIKYPVMDTANMQIVESFITKFRLAERQKQFEPEKGWEEYGLLKPSWKIGIETTRQPARRYLLIGDRSPVGDTYFARWEHENTYFLLAVSFASIFDQSIYTLRDKRVFRRLEQGIDKFAIQIGQEIYEISVREDAWVWEKPLFLKGRRVEPQMAEKLEGLIHNLYVKEYDEPADAAEYFRDGDVMKLWTRRGAVQSVQIGNEYVARDAFRLRRSGENQVLLVDRKKIRLLLEMIFTLAGESGGY